MFMNYAKQRLNRSTILIGRELPLTILNNLKPEHINTFYSLAGDNTPNLKYRGNTTFNKNNNLQKRENDYLK